MKKIILITVVILLMFTCFAYARINFLGFIRPLYSGGAGPAGDALLLETADYLLLETGDSFLLE